MKILQLGKFYPVKGGVEKVAYDLMTGISEQGIRSGKSGLRPDDRHFRTRYPVRHDVCHCFGNGTDARH